MEKQGKINYFLLFATALFVFIVVGSGAWMLFGRKQNYNDWSLYQLHFYDKFGPKHIYVQMKIEDDAELEEESDTKYTMQNGVNEVYSYEYYRSLEAMKEALVESQNSVDGMAGRGVYYSEKTETVGDYEYTKLLSYYNPISVTESGEYDENVSTVISTSYVYELPEEKGVIVFGFDSSQDGSVHKPEVLDIQSMSVTR